MRVLIASDIHGNVEALQAVLKDAESSGGFDQLWSLGDLVGYGPDPGACIDLIRQHDGVTIAGNHDLAATGRMTWNGFNPHALAAIKWTVLQISFDHYSWLMDLPVKQEVDGFTLVHGSPRAPSEEYLVSPEVAAANFPLLKTQFGLVGHSHIPFVCRRQNGTARFEKFPTDGTPVVLGDGPAFINPGGLGQPRDRDPDAPYVIYDSDQGTVSHHRAKYDIPSTQQRMKDNGLDRHLWERIAHGL